MVPLPGSATRMSPAAAATAELRLTNIAARLRMSAKSAASTTREKIRMGHLPMGEGKEKVVFLLQRECQISAAPNYRETTPLSFGERRRAGHRGSAGARMHQDHVSRISRIAADLYDVTAS